MVDVSKLVEDLSGLTVLEAAELARLLKERWKPPKVSLADIKRDLPLWPDEVINLWLFYLANRSSGDTGWPPPEPLGLHPWAFILGFRPLSWWREVTWKRERTDCSFSNLCQGTKHIVVRMLAEKANGTIDEETATRFKKAADYLLKNGRFREPPDCHAACRWLEHLGRQSPDNCVLWPARGASRDPRKARPQKTGAGAGIVHRNP